MAEYGLGEFTRNNNTYKYIAEIDVDSALSSTSENPVQNKVVKEALDTKANQATTYTKTETDNAIAAAAFIPTSAKGTANGVAELDNNGKIPSAQLPSYVDDVIEGYYDSTTDRFYEESSFTTVIPPEGNKSWVDIASNKSYRWSGSVYVRVDEGVQLGTTHGSAAYGDEGLAAYQHSQINSGNPHGTNLDDLSNVSIDNNITNGQVLKYENGEWINGTGGSTSLSNLSDTSIVNPTNGQILKYNGTNWINSNESGGGTTVIPNPQGTPTDELNSIQINNDIYEIVGGSSGGSSILTGYTMPTSNIGNNGDVYILFDALDPSYINPNFSNFGLNLTNWTYDYSDHFEIIYKMNSRQSGNWAQFIGTSGASNAGLYMQYNGWGNLSLINMYYNGVFSGDQTIPIDSIYDYVNYYKFVGSANNFTFYKGPALDNIATVAAQYTFSAATGSSNETVKLFKSIGNSSSVSTFDMNLYGIKVYNSNNELIHDYIPIADGLHDKVDNTDYVTSTSGHISHIGVPSNVLGVYYKNEGTWILISSDGTSVIANPTGTSTDELNSIQIDNTIYEIAGGGTEDYEDLINKPSLDGITLEGEMELNDFNLKKIITLSQAEYDALDPAEQADPDILYYINDASPTPQAIALENLSDVDISSPTNGQVLKYNSSNGTWVNSLGSGGASELNELDDVTVSTPTDGQVLKYDSTSGKWINDDESGETGGYVIDRWIRFDPSNKQGIIIKAGTAIRKSNGVIKAFATDTSVDFSSTIGVSDNGKDFFIYLNDDDSIIASTTKQNTGIKIGRFHTLCVDAGSNLTMIAPDSPSSGIVAGDMYLVKPYSIDTDPDFYQFYNKTVTSVSTGTPYDVITCEHPLSGYEAGDILPESIFCNTFYPDCLVEDAMVYDKATNICVDIYLQSGTGHNTRSAYNQTHTVSRQAGNHAADFNCIGKRFLFDDEFTSIARGSNECTAIQGTSDKTTVGGHSDTAGRRMLSAIGCEECCGYLLQWLGNLTGWKTESWGTRDGRGSFGQEYGDPYMVLAGGHWGDTSHCGSVSRYFHISQSNVYSNCCSRGCTNLICAAGAIKDSEIANFTKYSTTEQIVGQWIDGKPIYQKSWEFSTPLLCGAATWTDTVVSNNGISKLIGVEVIDTSGTSCWNGFGATIDSANNVIRLYNTRTTAGLEIKYMTLKYTKAAD